MIIDAVVHEENVTKIHVGVLSAIVCHPWVSNTTKEVISELRNEVLEMLEYETDTTVMF